MAQTSSWYFHDQQVDGHLADILRGLREDEGLSFHHMTIELARRHDITLGEPLIKKFYRNFVAA